MHLFVLILLLLIGAVFLTRLAAELSVPYPSLLALGGALVGLAPGIPHFTLEPSLALVIFVAPVLLDASYDVSPRDLKDNRIPIVTLVLVAVGLTTIAVAAVFHRLAPGTPWAAAIALGAIVAPPDAAAATAVLRQVNIPRRLVLILEGESLFNDASALLIFAIALRLTEDGSGNLALLLPLYGLSVIGSVALGLGLGWLYPRAVSVIRDPASLIVLQFCGTFGVWALAEQLHLSPILTIVAYGLGLARLGLTEGDPFVRVQSYSVWETVVFLTNVLAFTLIGFQLGPLLSRLSPELLAQYLEIAGIVLFVVIAVRMAWVMTYNTALRIKNWRFGTDLPGRLMRPTAHGGIIIAWSGMRGIVTLAAALALPEGFPERDLIQFVAFAVVLGTLLIQGLTLGLLVRLLPLPEDTQLEAETAVAKRRALEAALLALKGDDSKYAKALRVEYSAALALEEESSEELTPGLSEHDQVHVRAIGAAREAIADLHRSGEIGTAAYQRVQAALDRAELYASRYTLDG